MANLKYASYIHHRLTKKRPHPEITASIVSLKPKKEISAKGIPFEWCCTARPAGQIADVK